MKLFLQTIVMVSCCLSNMSLAAQEKPIIAVLPFTGSTGITQLDGSGTAMAEYVRTELATYSQFKAVERTVLEAAITEAGIKGIITPGQAVAAGKACNARFVITGSFAGTPTMLTIKTRIYDTTQQRWYSEDVTGSYKKRYPKMIEILAYNIRHTLTGIGGYITDYQLRPGWFASMAISSGVALFTSGVMYALFVDSYDNMYMDENQSSLEEIESNYQKANASFRASAVFAWTGLALTAATTYLLVSSYAKSNFITGSHGTHETPLSFVPDSDGGKLTYTLRF